MTNDEHLALVRLFAPQIDAPPQVAVPTLAVTAALPHGTSTPRTAP